MDSGVRLLGNDSSAGCLGHAPRHSVTRRSRPQNEGSNNSVLRTLSELIDTGVDNTGSSACACKESI